MRISKGVLTMSVENWLNLYKSSFYIKLKYFKNLIFYIELKACRKNIVNRFKNNISKTDFPILSMRTP